MWPAYWVGNIDEAGVRTEESCLIHQMGKVSYNINSRKVSLFRNCDQRISCISGKRISVSVFTVSVTEPYYESARIQKVSLLRFYAVSTGKQIQNFSKDHSTFISRVKQPEKSDYRTVELHFSGRLLSGSAWSFGKTFSSCNCTTSFTA